ncbi:MAG TPA: 3-hydroxyacyl-CoA dehydrogenase family protein [Sediminibacterium sp.]|nr:3-hydroxyacyl-CoA dehydrogenase family protein [Sediminibacterium sp.]
MHIVIKARPEKKELLSRLFANSPATISWVSNGSGPPAADAYFDDSFEEDGFAFESVTEKPVMVNAVIEVARSLPANCIRYNGWEGFLHQPVLEIAGANSESLSKAHFILDALQWTYIEAPDEPGMVSPRVVAMIINEAYYGYGESISSKKDIDIAMKLGTNYPCGPFEWSEMIGLHKIAALLEKLAATSSRYCIAPALKAAFTNQKKA